MKTIVIIATMTISLLTACGGGELQEGLPVLGPVDGPYCPADPSTFVGPLPEVCFDASEAFKK